MNYKKILTGITIAFAGLLLFFTFFSRTLADMHVPMVSLAFINAGTIRPEAVSHGVVVPADTHRFFAPISGRVTQVLGTGDEILRGTALFTITTDLQTLHDALTQAEHEQRITALNLERARADLSAANQRLNEMLAEPMSTPARPTLNLFEYDLQLAVNTADMERIEDDIARLEILLAQGAIPLQDITNRQNDLQRLEQARVQIYQRREQAIARFYENLQQYEESVEGAGRIRDANIQAQRNVISQINFTISGHNMEAERVERRIYDLTEQIEDGGVMEVFLDAEDFSHQRVTASNIPPGAFVQEGALVLETSLINNRFLIEASFPQIDDFIAVGQSVDIFVGTDVLDGRTARIIPAGGRNTVEIEVQSGALRGGEAVRVAVSGGVSNHANVIPLSALREDTMMGEHFFYIEAVPMRFGNHYYVRVHPINTGRGDSSYVAISSRGWGLDLPDAPIIVNSDIPVQPGTRVRLANSVDFTAARP